MPGSPALFFRTFPFGSPGNSISDFYNVIAAQMPAWGFKNVVQQSTNVAGRTPNSHVAITFVGANAQNTTAVAMAAGDDASAALDKLVNGVQNLTFL